MDAQSPEHRGLRTDDLQPWKLLDQTFVEPLYGLGGRAVKVDGDGALGGAPAQPDGELRTVDAIAQSRSVKQVKGVANRLAIRCDNMKILDSSAKCRVLRRGHHTVDRERCYQSR
jgi:hypothetical protein